MEPNKEDYYSVSDVLNNVKQFFRHVTKKWWLLMLAAMVGGGLGAAYYHVQKPKYEAVSTFILEEKQAGAGGLGSIASQFGLDIGGLGGGSMFTADNVLDILKSKKVVQKILLSQLDTTTSNSTSLADLYLDFSRMKENWKKNQELVKLKFNSSVPISAVQDSVLNIIYDRIVKTHLTIDRTSKRGTIIKVQVAAENSLFAKLMTERLVEEASKMYLNVKVGTALTNIKRLQRRSDSLLALLNNKSFAVASLQPLDVNPGIRTMAVPAEIATRDKTVLATLYTEVTKNLEASRMLLSQQTPIIQILDGPGLSLYDNKKSLLFLIIIGSLVSLGICLSSISIAYFFKRSL